MRPAGTEVLEKSRLEGGFKDFEQRFARKPTTIGSKTFSWFQKLQCFKEKSELDKFCDERINESIKKYQNIIRGFLIFISLCNLGIWISSYFVNQEGKNHSSVADRGMYWTALFVFLTITMKYYPKILIYVKPLIIFFGLKTAADVAYYEDAYPFHFMTLVIYSFSYCMAIVIPYLSMISSLCFIVGNTYLLSCLYLYSEKYSVTMICCVILCCGHFTISNYILENKQRSLFTELMNRKKKSIELKKILQMFPLGVVIYPESKDSKNWYTNTEFDQKFIKINQSLEELSNINVSIKE